MEIGTREFRLWVLGIVTAGVVLLSMTGCSVYNIKSHTDRYEAVSSTGNDEALTVFVLSHEGDANDVELYLADRDGE